jgi:hypothetical protein
MLCNGSCMGAGMSAVRPLELWNDREGMGDHRHHPLHDRWDRNPVLAPCRVKPELIGRAACEPVAAESAAVPMIRDLGREATGHSQRNQERVVATPVDRRL